MSILRFDPLRDPFREMDRLTAQLLSGTRTPASLPMDVWRTEDAYRVALDLPGMDPDSLEVTLERGALTIRAERGKPFGDDEAVLVAERAQGTFTRQLVLGDDLDSDAVEADYRNGVLHLRIPVARTAQPKRVRVRHDGATSIGATSPRPLGSTEHPDAPGSAIPGTSGRRESAPAHN